MKASFLALLWLLPLQAGTEKFCVDPASAESLNR